MTITDIVTKDGIDADFMHWLWNIDRKTYTLILLGHIELITDDLIEQYAKERQKMESWIS